jgi:rubrerythrin
MKKRWKCVECGYVQEGEHPPDTCPVCYAPYDAFIEVVNA